MIFFRLWCHPHRLHHFYPLVSWYLCYIIMSYVGDTWKGEGQGPDAVYLVKDWEWDTPVWQFKSHMKHIRIECVSHKFPLHYCHYCPVSSVFSQCASFFSSSQHTNISWDARLLCYICPPEALGIPSPPNLQFVFPSFRWLFHETNDFGVEGLVKSSTTQWCHFQAKPPHKGWEMVAQPNGKLLLYHWVFPWNPSLRSTLRLGNVNILSDLTHIAKYNSF